MKQHFYTFIFTKCMGWKIVGEIEEQTTKCVLAVVPHTHWYDFFLGIFTRGITKREMNFVAKKELFVFPFDSYFRWMGGTALDRTSGQDKVEAIASLFEKRDVFRLAIAPEGTRKKVEKLKTGFYYIAHKAKVPIIPVAFDFGKKEVNIGKPFYTTGNIDLDLPKITQHFKGVKGKISENSFEV